MKNFWENVKLGNISSMQYGFTASAKEKEVGPKFLRITDIVKDSINWSTVPYCKINNTNYKKYKIENDGDFTLVKEWGEGEMPDSNDFLCDKCFKEGKF